MGDDWNIYNSSCNWVLLCNFVSFKWVLSFIKLNYLTSLKVMYKQPDGYTTYPLHRSRSLNFPWQTYCKFRLRLGSGVGGGERSFVYCKFWSNFYLYLPSTFKILKYGKMRKKSSIWRKSKLTRFDFLKINIMSPGYSFILIRTEVYAWETARNNKLIINNIGVKREPEYNVTFCDLLFTPHLLLGWKIYIECNIYVEWAKVIMVTPEFCLSPISRPA